MTSGVITKLRHPKLGPCDLVRVEATDWIVRVESTGILFRIPSEARSQFDTVRDEAPVPPESPARIEVAALQCPDARRARRVIESLRVGLPSLDGTTRQLAVGFHKTESLIGRFLRDIDEDGGGAMILKGAYGQGKTFALMILEQVALESGFLAARTEIDATENRLNKPHHIYRDLMRNLKLPDYAGPGIRGLAEKTVELLNRTGLHRCGLRKQWLHEQLGCFPLAWLLSDPQLIAKPTLIGLLEGDPNCPASRARKYHAWWPEARLWPVFNASTQGDFGSFLLAGIGRLARVLGYKGLVVIMDKMEKWNQLNWTEQTRAGNLLGGLIWGATAKEGQRGMRDHPRILQHSGRCGGYPFTTEEPAHLGVALAMTPRTHSDPYRVWCEYGGPILIGEVPKLGHEQIITYCLSVVPFFAEAYGLSAPTEEELDEIAADAVYAWRKYDDLTTRSGVQSVIAAFDSWRESKCFRN